MIRKDKIILELQINELAEISYRNWLIAILKNIKKYPRKQAINLGAEEQGINPQTARRYNDKLVSDSGPLKEEMNLLKWLNKDLHIESLLLLATIWILLTGLLISINPLGGF